MAEPEDLSSPENLAQRWMEHLAEEGYRPQLEGPDEDGDHFIRVKVEGTRYTLSLPAKDPTFLTIATYFSLPEPPVELERLRVAALDTTASIKAAKAILDVEDGGVRFQVDVLLEDPARFARTFARVIRMLDAASDHFFEAVQPESES